MGSKAGAMKTAATRLGISVEDYAARTWPLIRP